MASWNVYAQRVRSYNQEIWGAAIFGVDGTLWGQDGVNITNDHTTNLKQDIKTIVEVVNDFENTNSKVFTDGFRFFEKQWAVVRVDAGLMVGKGKAPNSSQFAARKANKCIVIALARDEGSKANALSGAVQIGDWLEDAGF